MKKTHKMKEYEVKLTLLTDGADTASSVKHLIEILEEEVKLSGIEYSIKNIKVKAKVKPKSRKKRTGKKKK